MVCGMLWFFTGVGRFMDAPIRPCAIHGYCGKFGWPHSKEQYEAFNFWELTLFAIWPLVVVSMGLLGWMQRAETKQKSVDQNAVTARHDPPDRSPTA